MISIINLLLNQGGGGGASYSSEFQALLDRANALGYTQTSFKSQTDAFIAGLVADGDWAEADLGYILATDQADFSRINIISPADYLATIGGLGAAHTANTGWTSGGAGYLNTGWNPATNGVQFLKDDCSFHIAVTQAPTVLTQSLLGSRNVGGDAVRIQANLDYYMNSSSTSAIAGDAATGSIYSVYRTAAGATAIYKDGISIGTPGVASTNVPSIVMYLLALNNNGAATGFIDGKIGFFLAGSSSINPVDVSARWATYKTAIGL